MGQGLRKMEGMGQNQGNYRIDRFRSQRIYPIFSYFAAEFVTFRISFAGSWNIKENTGVVVWKNRFFYRLVTDDSPLCPPGHYSKIE